VEIHISRWTMRWDQGDLINCQEGRSELSSFQVGNGRRSVDDLIDCQEGSDGSSSFQVGNEEGSLDLIDCQGAEEESQIAKWARERR
jgi:hypothetical protein